MKPATAVSTFTRNSVGVAVVIAVLIVAFFQVGGKSDGPSVALTREPVATSMQTSKDGFGFPNFPAAATFESFNTADMVKVIGADACKNGIVDPCVLTAQATAWAQMVNQARESGHCEGFVVTSAWRFLRQQTPHTSQLENSGDTTHAIFRSFSTQFFPDVRKQTSEWAGKSLVEKISALSDALRRGQLEYSMGVYTDKGGHAILPYAIEYTDNDIVIIRVYDSNWPGRNRFVSIDLQKKKWSFSFSSPDPLSDSSPWTGESDMLDLTPLESRTSSRKPLGSGAVDETFLLIRSMLPNWSVESGSDVITPSTQSVALRPKPMHSDKAKQIPEYLVRVPKGKLKLNLRERSSVFVVSKRAVIRLTTKKAVAQPIVITESTITNSDPSTTVSTAVGDIALTTQDISSTITIGDSRIEASVSGTDETVVADTKSPQIKVTSVNDKVEITTGSEFETVIPQLPAPLIQETELPGLPPATTRDMSVDGYQVDTYVPPAAVSVVTPSTVAQSSGVAYVENSSTSTSSSTTTTSTTAPATTTTRVISTTTTTTTTVPPSIQQISVSVPTGTTSTTTSSTSTSTTTTTMPMQLISTSTTSTSTTTTSTTTTSSLPATCANGGTCAIGDIGPGGGRVFYVAANGANYPWKYLEVAPANAASDTRWCNYDTTTLPGSFSREIGTGAANTSLILGASACQTGNSAALAADTYVSPNGTSDWYLPSIKELNLLYPLRASVGMPNTGNFWSSSQNSSIYAEAQSFLDGGNPSWYKTQQQGYHARAIRSFGTP